VSDHAYYVGPPEAPGPGVLLLHSWWGLTPFFKGVADGLADEGYTVLAPDLNRGMVFDDPLDAERHLADMSADGLARLTLSSARMLAERGRDERISVVGFSMGASLGLWASVRMPDVIDSVAAFYGVQTIDFDGSRAAYQVHLADDDPLVPDDDAAFMEATVGLVDQPIDMFRYPGTSHWFFESDRAEYDPVAGALAWDRTLSFLHGHASSRA